MLSFMRKNKKSFAEALFLVLSLSFMQSIFAVNSDTVIAEAKASSVTGVAKADISEKSEDRYLKASKFYLPSLAKQEQIELEIAKKIKEENEKFQKETKAKNESFIARYSFVTSKAVVKIADLGSTEMQKLVYELFSDSVKDKKQFSNSMLTDCVFGDLELFCGATASCADKSVFSHIDRTVTPFGKAELQSFFTEKFDNVEKLTKKLQKRQEIVKHLVENEALFNKLDQKLIEMSKNASQLMFFFKGLDDTSKISLDKFYTYIFGEKFSRFVNEQPLAYKLSGKTGMVAGVSLLLALLPVLLKSFGIGFGDQLGGARELLSTVGKSIGIEGGLGDFGQGCTLVSSLAHFLLLNGGASLLLWNHLLVLNKTSYLNVFVTFLLFACVIKKFNINVNNVISKMVDNVKKLCVTKPILAVYLLMLLVIVGVSCRLTYKSFASGWEATRVGSLFIDNKVKGVSFFAGSLQDIAEILENDKLLGNDFNLKLLLGYNVAGDNEQEVGTLIKELSDLSTVLKESGLPTETQNYFSFSLTKAKVRSSFKKIQRLKDGFVGSLKAIGRLDAYMSIAKLYKEYAGTQVQFCFPEFVKADSPYVNIKDFWFPMINPKWAVTNSIELGSEKSGHNVILTGPNAAGKSTALRGIIGSLILAQTLGIAPASKMVLTPFARINSHLNISDEVGRESLYQAEKNRVKGFLSELKLLGKGEFEFTIMDEMFSSTNPEEGQSAAYAIAKSLVKVPNCMCLLATHFKKLTELEADTNGYYKNYKVYVDVQPDGTFRCPYKIVPGLSNQNIAILMMQHEFDADIVNEAYDVLSQVKEDTSEIVGFEQNKDARK